jgi:DNA/RNA-binding domain of Phe-tRNA-synthetase-like protein
MARLTSYCPMECTELEDLVRVGDDARELGVFVAYTVAGGPPPTQASHVLDGEVEKLVSELRKRYTLESLKDDPVVRAYRDFYWRIGIDPTKIRPSSEALVRRALRGRFPRISPLVDAGNVASARTMVPIGLYDARYFKPPLAVRRARGGEVFEPIGGSREVLKPGTPVMVDAEGAVIHVYPHRDSRRTMVRDDTSCILVVGAGVPGVPRGLVRRAVEEVSRLLELLGWSSCSVFETG